MLTYWVNLLISQSHPARMEVILKALDADRKYKSTKRRFIQHLQIFDVFCDAVSRFEYTATLH